MAAAAAPEPEWNLLFQKTLNSRDFQKYLRSANTDNHSFFHSIPTEGIRNTLSNRQPFQVQLFTADGRMVAANFRFQLGKVEYRNHAPDLAPSHAYFLIYWQDLINLVGANFFRPDIEASVYYRWMGDHTLQLKVEQPVGEFQMNLNEQVQPWVLLTNHTINATDVTRRYFYVPHMDMSAFQASFQNPQAIGFFNPLNPQPVLHASTVTAALGEPVTCQIEGVFSVANIVGEMGFRFYYRELVDSNPAIFQVGVTLGIYYRWVAARLEVAIIGPGEPLPA